MSDRDIDVEFTVENYTSMNEASTDLRACSPNIIQYAMKLLVKEVPYCVKHRLPQESDHAKMFRTAMIRIYLDPNIPFRKKALLLNKYANISDEIKEVLRKQ